MVMLPLKTIQVVVVYQVHFVNVGVQLCYFGGSGCPFL